MDCEKIGKLIRRLREEKAMTQRQLAERLGVSDRAVSKWERGSGCPDVSLLADLAAELSVGVEALLSGDVTEQEEMGKSMKHTKYYVCPRCGNLLLATGDAAITCCGRSLEPLDPVKAAEEEKLRVEPVEDERFLTSSHPMTKEHHISFLAFATGDRIVLQRLYPEWDLQARIPGRGHGKLLWYCTQHGLFYQLI